MITLKAPRNYSDQFWSNQISVLLLEGPKSPNSMISGFLSPWEPLFIDLDIPKYWKRLKEQLCKQFRKIFSET